MVYFILMIAQFHDHDYYFLDSFYIPVLLYTVMCIDSFSLKNMPVKVLFAVVVILFGYLSFQKCEQDKSFRYSVDLNNRSYLEFMNFQGSSQFLDALKISPSSKILVLDAYTTNYPFIFYEQNRIYVNGS